MDFWQSYDIDVPILDIGVPERSLRRRLRGHSEKLAPLVEPVNASA